MKTKKINMNNIYKIATYYRKLQQKCPVLYLFLKEKKVLKAFAKNCKYEKYPKDIVTAFTWDKTIEKSNFWAKLSMEFGKYKDNLRKEL